MKDLWKLWDIYACHRLKKNNNDNSSIEIESNAVIFTLLKYTIQWVFSLFTELCDHHHYLISECFPHMQKGPHVQAVTAIHLFSNPWQPPI